MLKASNLFLLYFVENIQATYIRYHIYYTLNSDISKYLVYRNEMTA